jgi:hypothetical protein
MNYNLMLCLVLLPIKFLTKLISILGSTNSGSNNVRLKPFSASIFKFLSVLVRSPILQPLEDFLGRASDDFANLNALGPVAWL